VPFRWAVRRGSGRGHAVANDERNMWALHCLSRALVATMLTGVTEGYRKILGIVGIGYRMRPEPQPCRSWRSIRLRWMTKSPATRVVGLLRQRSRREMVGRKGVRHDYPRHC
jgi:hypothetical protein